MLTSAGLTYERRNQGNHLGEVTRLLPAMQRARARAFRRAPPSELSRIFTAPLVLRRAQLSPMSVNSNGNHRARVKHDALFIRGTSRVAFARADAHREADRPGAHARTRVR